MQTIQKVAYNKRAKKRRTQQDQRYFLLVFKAKKCKQSITAVHSGFCKHIIGREKTLHNYEKDKLNYLYSLPYILSHFLK